MKLPVAAVASTALFALAACGQEAGLKGPMRDSFVSSAVQSCSQKQSSDPANAGIPAATITSYCTCYANAMADRMSEDEVRDVALGDQEKMRAMLQPKAEAASTACRSAITNGKS